MIIEWNSVEIEPKKKGIFLVLCFDKMYYFANFTKRDKWHSFTHFIGPIKEDTEWARSIQVRVWLDLNLISKINFPQK